MNEARPAWYTAVPKMHQAILSLAWCNADTIADVHLRFLHSSSVSLPLQVMQQLRETFGALFVQAYGMTDATQQMCCNPLVQQKAGSVGVTAGPKVAIAHEIKNQLSGGTGEELISGPDATRAYEGKPAANVKNRFDIDGKRWFRTGEQGAFDAGGFLHLTGRLKEIINRGATRSAC